MKTKKLKLALLFVVGAFLFSACTIVNFNVEGEGGAISATVGGKDIDVGSDVAIGKEVVFTATPNDGYQLCFWSVNDSIIDNQDLEYRFKKEAVKFDTLNITVSFVKSGPGYPDSLYKLSADGTELVDWMGETDVLDMNADCTLKKVKIISNTYTSASHVKELIIGDRVKEVLPGVHWGYGIEKMVIPKSVSKMEGGFMIKELETIVLSPDNESYTLVDGVLFTKDMKTLVLCPSKRIGAYIIPDGVTHIAENAFYHSNLSEVRFPETLIEIGKNAFRHSSQIKKINIPNSVTTIKEWAFSYIESLEEFHIGSGVTTVEANPIGGSPNVKKLTIDENNTAFIVLDGCLFSKDKTVLIAYCNTKNEKSYSIPDGVKTIGSSAFDLFDNLEAIIIPNSVTTVESYSIHSCSNLKELTFPNSVEIIKGSACRYASSVTKLTLGSGLKAAHDCAFEYYESLKEVISYSVNPPKADTNASTFYRTDISKVTLFVPKGSKQAYQNAEVWRDFGKIVEM